MATLAYVDAKRRTYEWLKSTKAKSVAIDDFCQVTGTDRKHVLRLLTGSRRFCGHAGRGKTLTPQKT